MNTLSRSTRWDCTQHVPHTFKLHDNHAWTFHILFLSSTHSDGKPGPVGEHTSMAFVMDANGYMPPILFLILWGNQPPPPDAGPTGKWSQGFDSTFAIKYINCVWFLLNCGALNHPPPEAGSPGPPGLHGKNGHNVLPTFVIKYSNLWRLFLISSLWTPMGWHFPGANGTNGAPGTDGRDGSPGPKGKQLLHQKTSFIQSTLWIAAVHVHLHEHPRVTLLTT